MKKTQADKAAFTLVELLIASVIGVLAISIIAGVTGAGFRVFAHLSGDVAVERDVLKLIYYFEQDVSSAVNTEEKRFAGNKYGFNLVRLYSLQRSDNSIRLYSILWSYDNISGKVVRTVYDGDEILSADTFYGIKSFSVLYAGEQDEPAENPDVNKNQGKANNAVLEWTEEWNHKKIPGIVQAEINGNTLRTAVMGANFSVSKKGNSRK